MRQFVIILPTVHCEMMLQMKSHKAVYKAEYSTESTIWQFGRAVKGSVPVNKGYRVRVQAASLRSFLIMGSLVGQ